MTKVAVVLSSRAGAPRAAFRPDPAWLLLRVEVGGDGADETGAGSAAAALRSAAEQSDVVVLGCDDGRHPLDRIAALALPVASGSADLCLARREGWPPLSALRGALTRALAWTLGDASDPLLGFAAVRSERLRELAPDLPPDAVPLALLLDERAAPRLAEIGVRWSEAATSVGATSPSAACVARLLAWSGVRARSGALRRGAIAAAAVALLDVAGTAGLARAGLPLRAAVVASFALSLALLFALASSWVPGVRRVRGGAASLRFALVAALALPVRAALFAWGAALSASGAAALSPVAAALCGFFGAFLGGALVLLGSAFYAFADRAAVPSARRFDLASAALVLYLLLLRSVYLGLPELLPDEAYHWTWATHLDWSYLDHPPLTAWVIWLSTALFGHGELAVRAGAWLTGAVTIGFLYALGRELYGRGVGLRTALLGACLPLYFVMGFAIFPDSTQFAAWSACLYFAVLALLRERASAWWALGACLGIGFLAKYNVAMLGIGVAVFTLVDPRARHWLRRKEPYGAALLALALTTPVLVWNAQHDWASFAFQTSRRLDRHSSFALPWMLLHGAMILSPAGIAIALGSAWPGARNPLGRPGGDDERRVRRLLFTLAAVPLLPYAIHALAFYPRAHWTAPCWISLLPLVARALPARADAGRVLRALQRTWAPTFALLALVFGLLLQHLVIGLPGVPYPRPFDRYFWKQTVPEVQRLLAEVEREAGAPPVLGTASKWSIAASLSFYGPPDWQHTIGSRHYFGEDASMWSEWNPYERDIGRPMLLLGLNRKDLEESHVVQSLEGAGPVETLTIERDGVPLRWLYYRKVRRYVGPPGWTR